MSRSGRLDAGSASARAPDPPPPISAATTSSRSFHSEPTSSPRRRGAPLPAGPEGEGLEGSGPSQNGAKRPPRLRWRLPRLLAPGLRRPLGPARRRAGPPFPRREPSPAPLSQARPRPVASRGSRPAALPPPLAAPASRRRRRRRGVRVRRPHKMAVGSPPCGRAATLTMVAVYPVFLLPSAPQLPRCFE